MTSTRSQAHPTVTYTSPEHRRLCPRTWHMGIPSLPAHLMLSGPVTPLASGKPTRAGVGFRVTGVSGWALRLAHGRSCLFRTGWWPRWRHESHSTRSSQGGALEPVEANWATIGLASTPSHVSSQFEMNRAEAVLCLSSTSSYTARCSCWAEGAGRRCLCKCRRAN